MVDMFNNEKAMGRFRDFITDRIVLVTVSLALILTGLVSWLLYTKFHQQTEFVPLHYNIYFGIDLYGPWYQILTLPATGLGLLFINFILSFILYKRVKLFSYALLISLDLCGLMLLGSGWLIVSQLLT
ncbi:MAG: hypothetical protein WC497_01235 [Patescibacteria group bacterium]